MKSHNLQSDISYFKRAFVLAFVYCALFNLSICIYKHDNGIDLATILWENFLVLLMLTFSFIGFSIDKVLLATYSIFLYGTGALTSFYIYTEKLLPTKKIVADFFDVDSIKDYDNVSLIMILWVIFSIWICIYLLRRFNAKANSNKISVIILFILFILSIANVITPFSSLFKSYLPIEYLHNSYHYFLDKLIVS